MNNKFKVASFLVPILILGTNTETIIAEHTVPTPQNVVLTPLNVVNEITPPEPKEEQIDPIGVDITLYNEVSGSVYMTGYPVYMTDYVLDCSTYFCNVNGYTSIVINEYWAEMYPRGTTATMVVDEQEISVMVVDYRSLEHSQEYYSVGVIGDSTNGEVPATIYKEGEKW